MEVPICTVDGDLGAVEVLFCASEVPFCTPEILFSTVVADPS